MVGSAAGIRKSVNVKKYFSKKCFSKKVWKSVFQKKSVKKCFSKKKV
jgi:hypothetical protein